MRLYMVRWHDAQDGALMIWCSSQIKAKAEISRVTKQRYIDGEIPEFEVREVSFPTNKPGVIAWLNANYNTDNG